MLTKGIAKEREKYIGYTGCMFSRKVFCASAVRHCAWQKNLDKITLCTWCRNPSRFRCYLPRAFATLWSLVHVHWKYLIVLILQILTWKTLTSEQDLNNDSNLNKREKSLKRQGTGKEEVATARPGLKDNITSHMITDMSFSSLFFYIISGV